jgi:hypothetical protein
MTFTIKAALSVQWDGEKEGAAFPLPALKPDTAAVEFNHAFR